MSNTNVRTRTWRNASLLCVFAAMVVIFSSDVAPAQSVCENIKNLVFLDTTITVAQSLAAGSEPAPGSDLLPIPICRIVAHIKPSSDSDILIEAWLPATGWNGKFLGTGNGQFYGQIMYSELLNGIKRGYATISSDAGHQSGALDASWALGHPEKLTDFMYRAVHQMTVKGKEIAQAYYGRASQRSYWTGCSTAGTQGLTEAQLYPEDYDGIAISAPVNNWSNQMGAHLYNAIAALKNGPSAPEYIPPAKWTLMTNSALSACDGRDGLEDGLIGDPSACNFDPAILMCPSGDGANCLTAAQVETARKIYAGARFSDGQQFYPGLLPSGEIEWAPVLGGPEPYQVAVNHFKYLVFGNPNWDWRTFKPDTDVPLANSVQSAGMNARDPNLARFKARGGKLIMWHGWLDPIVFAKNSVDYYRSVVDAMGGKAGTDDFFRLFLAPGVRHCGGGAGPGIIDDLSALARWVEEGIAPAQIEAVHYSLGFANGTIDRRRPLCPYPQVALYRGTGDINVPESFYCEAPNSTGPQSVTVVSGTPQNAKVGTPLTAPFFVTVTDAASNPVSAVVVTFTAPSAGAAATFGQSTSVTVETDGAGIAVSPLATANGITGTYTVTASVAGVSIPATFSIINTTVTHGLTMFGATAPQTFFAQLAPVEVGLKFRSDVDGKVAGVRFYKGLEDTTTHTGSLWSASGTLLATGKFTVETPSGWQELTFSAPIPITANTTYVVSYHTGGPYYASIYGLQAAGVDRPPLHALRDGTTEGPNGVYGYGNGGVFPNQTYQAANYWADVIFVPNPQTSKLIGASVSGKGQLITNTISTQ